MMLFISFGCLFQFFQISAQISDDFSDGNHSFNPTWLGDHSHFIVNASLELQLNAPVAGTSTLYLPISVSDSNVWEFLVRLDFDPSSANRLRIYLQSDGVNFSTSKGYFLAIGKDGNLDAIEFYRQEGATTRLLATGTLGAVAFSPKPRIRITREHGGQWTLYVDYNGGRNFQKEFSIKDDTYPGGDANFGIQCFYSSTRRDKFFFDDIFVSPLLPDRAAPVLVNASVVSDRELDVLFNEVLEELSATEPGNYKLDNGIGSPSGAFINAVNQAQVRLVFSRSFTNLVNYTLITTGVKDPAGNIGGSQQASFQYFQKEQAEEFDILINEIMADPSPQIGLPNFEFIELYNRSNKIIDLAGFGFSSGGTPQLFPGYLLMPNKYVLVCSSSNEEALKKFGPVVPLSSFPGLANENDDLTLYGPGGKIIHFVNYSLSWYRDSKKSEGGWTLEMINPLNPCGESENWTASINLIGGTPGQPNSVLKVASDNTLPELSRISATQAKPYEVLVYFSEGMEKASAQNPASYSIDNGISIFSATLLPLSRSGVQLILNNPLQPNLVYNLTVSKQLKDCSGNLFGTVDKLPFALPVPMEPQDIVINEILFNPATGGSDFLELYNRSNKVLDLTQLNIANLQSAGSSIFQISTNRLFYPGDYVVLTPSVSDIQSRYKILNPVALVNNSLPTLPDDKGNVTIYYTGGLAAAVIDSFDYNREMHHPLLKDENGVSLERLNPNGKTQEAGNWHSAASAAGYATPGYKNSQYFNFPSQKDEFVNIPEPKLSPDGDGFQDYLIININPDKSGYLATIKIFDSEGRLVKVLANNDLQPAEGFYRWDGDIDTGAKARMGIYVISIQLFNPDGSVKEYKKTCVVAGKL